MSKGKVTVLGVNGHLGQFAAKAFVATGWDVSGMARTDKAQLDGVRFVAGNSDSVEDMRRAIGDADVVVNALNLPYHTWFDGRSEGQMARVIEAMGRTGKTMLFPGNIYNFAASDRQVTPDLGQDPETVRGQLRVRVEQGLAAAAERGDVQVIVVRAGDFYGPGAAADWFDQAVFREIGKGIVAPMGLPGVGHSWAYLPDLGRAFEAVASMRTSLGAFENFHFAGHFVTPEQMGATIAKFAPVPVRIKPTSLLLLRLIGFIDPIMREISKMAYLWRNPMELLDPRLDALLGEGFTTPFETAIATTVRPFFDAKDKPRKSAEPLALKAV